MVQSALALEGEVTKGGWTDTPNTSDRLIGGSSKREPALWGSLMCSSREGEEDAVAVAPARCVEGSPRAKVRRSEQEQGRGPALEPIPSWRGRGGAAQPQA